MVKYLPFKKRNPDSQYRRLLKRIISQGEKVFPQQEEEAIFYPGFLMRFKLENGFPIITERDLVNVESGKRSNMFQALGELFAFLNGAHTQENLKNFGCTWWKRWVTPEKCGKRGLEIGDLGPGSYGAAWRNFPTLEGKSFDQITNLIEQINELPHLRTHFVSPWIPQYTYRGKGKQQKVVVVPCHGWFHIIINVQNRRMRLIHEQRSADVPVGLVCNLIQYAALLMMLAQITNYEPYELVYFISDAHIYVNQLKDVHEILSTKPERFPTVKIDPSVTDIFKFRQNHFTVEDYHPQLPGRVIWTPV